MGSPHDHLQSADAAILAQLSDYAVPVPQIPASTAPIPGQEQSRGSTSHQYLTPAPDSMNTHEGQAASDQQQDCSVSSAVVPTVPGYTPQPNGLPNATCDQRYRQFATPPLSPPSSYANSPPAGHEAAASHSLPPQLPPQGLETTSASNHNSVWGNQFASAQSGQHALYDQAQGAPVSVTEWVPVKANEGIPHQQMEAQQTGQQSFSQHGPAASDLHTVYPHADQKFAHTYPVRGGLGFTPVHINQDPPYQPSQPQETGQHSSTQHAPAAPNFQTAYPHPLANLPKSQTNLASHVLGLGYPNAYSSGPPSPRSFQLNDPHTPAPQSQTTYPHAYSTQPYANPSGPVSGLPYPAASVSGLLNPQTYFQHTHQIPGTNKYPVLAPRPPTSTSNLPYTQHTPTPTQRAPRPSSYHLHKLKNPGHFPLTTIHGLHNARLENMRLRLFYDSTTRTNTVVEVCADIVYATSSSPKSVIKREGDELVEVIDPELLWPRYTHLIIQDSKLLADMGVKKSERMFVSAHNILATDVFRLFPLRDMGKPGERPCVAGSVRHTFMHWMDLRVSGEEPHVGDERRPQWQEVMHVAGELGREVDGVEEEILEGFEMFGWGSGWRRSIPGAGRG
ncbi:hypothetical protein M011DRAFT_479678 [Sporormia fimetaria CBS 119925]|uniref:Uncharacterized protein n=1 Tax=Sporormia fimetaria CBS 119925 TaxID=1340428 RepID=A0A6A6V3N5_9PLEO|nr:hypothetical protein M011DRAFT_479678 [Sporormia fimetaria CBS 119925]